MESFQESLKRAVSDDTLTSYFIYNNIDFHSFLKRYIQIDQILSMGDSDKLEINSLQQFILKQNEQIASLSNSFLAFQNNFETSLKNLTSNDIKNLLSDQLNSIQSHLSNPINYHSFMSLLQNFQDKLVNLNTEQLNDIDRKSINLLSNFQSNLLKDISTTLDSHTIHHKITSINDTLTLLHNNFTGNSSQKGKMTENVLYQNLLKAFPESDVVLSRDQPDSCDIQIIRDTKPTILIDSKHCEASNVRKSDLDKFYEDCKLNNSCGILCNAFGGIANRKHFEIDIQDKRVLVFISNHQFDPVMFQLASRIIYNVHSIIQEQRTDVIQIDQQLYQRLKIEFNFFLQSFHQHLDNIKANVNALSSLTFSHLDNFFKRTSLHSELKPFSCHLCATGCSSAKTLKKHLKDKHTIVPPPTPKTPKTIKTPKANESQCFGHSNESNESQCFGQSQRFGQSNEHSNKPVNTKKNENTIQF
jgi:hypothetical protein